MILVSNWGQRQFRNPEPPFSCVNADNFNQQIVPGSGWSGNATDEEWASQAAVAAMRGNMVILLHKVPWTEGSRLNTGWTTIYRAANKGMVPTHRVETVCKSNGHVNSETPLRNFNVDGDGFEQLKADFLREFRHPAFARLMFSDVLGGRQYTSIQPFSIHYTVPVSPNLLVTPSWKVSCFSDTKTSCLVSPNIAK